MQSILYKGYLFLQSSFQKQFYCQKVNTITDDTIFCIMLNNQTINTILKVAFFIDNLKIRIKIKFILYSSKKGGSWQ